MATLTSYSPPSYEGRGQTDEGGVCLLGPIFTMKGRAEREREKAEENGESSSTHFPQSSLSVPFQSIYCIWTLPLSFSILLYFPCSCITITQREKKVFPLNRFKMVHSKYTTAAWLVGFMSITLVCVCCLHVATSASKTTQQNQKDATYIQNIFFSLAGI